MKVPAKTFYHRPVSIINGIPFYSSSGANSYAGGTWLPVTHYAWKFMKPGEDNLWDIGRDKPIWVDEKDKQWRYNGWNVLAEELKESSLLRAGRLLDQYGNWLQVRFGSLPCMLISAKIGGGFWDSEEGKELLEIVLNES